MSRARTVVAFVLAVAIVLAGFAPAGTAIGELAFDVHQSLREGGSSAAASALVPLLAVDVAALLIVLLVSFLGGVRLPSGLPHLFFALFVPLALGAMQVRFFELSGDPASLSDTFGTYNFIAMFALSIGLAQLGVHLARRRHEGTLG